jgi:hypothetical protein
LLTYALFHAGSGCIAALEAEKFLAESQEETTTAVPVAGNSTTEPVAEAQGTKQKNAIGIVPEYRQNHVL